MYFGDEYFASAAPTCIKLNKKSLALGFEAHVGAGIVEDVTKRLPRVLAGTVQLLAVEVVFLHVGRGKHYLQLALAYPYKFHKILRSAD